jgi:hypothetical protein
MGANAQTTVPSFTIGQVLTADQQNQSARTGVPVFATTVERDAAFGGAGEKTLAEGQLCYLEDTNKVQYYDGAAWANLGSVTNVEAFTASGTFTPPAGVTYAIAHIRAGGGGTGLSSSATGTGGTSSVAFAGGTISAIGGLGQSSAGTTSSTGSNKAGTVNSGQGGKIVAVTNGGTSLQANDDVEGLAGAYIVAGGAVTPAVGITVTVGAGGTAGTGGTTGGSGYVWIEYQV